MDSLQDREDFADAKSERNDNIPTLADMLAAAPEASKRIAQGSKAAFMAWLQRAEWLWLARTHYELSGGDYEKFHKQIGVNNKGDASMLPRLHPYRDRAIAHYQTLANASEQKSKASGNADSYQWPGWKTALKAMEKLYEPDRPRNKKNEADAADETDSAETVRQHHEERLKKLAEEAERKQNRLRARIIHLEDVLAKHGIEVPPEAAPTSSPDQNGLAPEMSKRGDDDPPESAKSPKADMSAKPTRKPRKANGASKIESSRIGDPGTLGVLYKEQHGAYPKQKGAE